MSLRLKALGISAAIVSKVGRDQLGERLIKYVENTG